MEMKRFLGLVLFLFLFLILKRGVLAVEGTFNIADKEVVDGDVIASLNGQFVRAKIPYDNSIFGVYVVKPVVVFRNTEQGNKPIVRSGVTMVNVIGANGAIAVGDYITASETPGKAMKATKSGYILGIANGIFNGSGEGKIPVIIRIEYAELTTARSTNRLLEYLGQSFLSNAKDPEKFGQIVRYVLAGLIVLGSVGVAFLTFSRALPKAIEAIGRNPLARHTIYLSMALNVGLIVVVIGLGIGGALLILRF